MSRKLYEPFAGPITAETLPQLFAHQHARFGGMFMEDPPVPTDRPEGVSEDEWTALGDPGKRALVRERDARIKAENDLKASKTPKPGPPAPAPAPAPAPTPATTTATDPADIAKIVADAVAAAVKPLQEAETQRQTDAAAAKVRDSVLEAARTRLHDPSDAIGNVDLTAVITEHGVADPAKISAELDRVLAAKPHLAKNPQRIAPLGIGGGAPAAATEGERVAAALAQMQSSTGIRPPAAATS